MTLSKCALRQSMAVACSLALTSALLRPPSADAAAKVIFTEIHYNPAGATDAVREFIELKNVGDEPALMGGWTFTAGFGYTFPGGTSLPEGGFLVLALSKPNFDANYAALGVQAFASYSSGNLTNSGERVTLQDGLGNTIFSVKYGDGSGADPTTGTADEFENARWPDRADGENYSLVSLDPNDNPDPDDYRNWRPSIRLHGSPGSDDPLPSADPDDYTVYINEIRSRDGVLDNDAVELYNPGPDDINVGGWHVTDSLDSPQKAGSAIPPGTLVPAGGYTLLQNGDGAGIFQLSISSKGERAFLFSSSGGVLTGWVHGYHTESSQDGKTFARFVGSDGKEQFLVDDPSMGGPNGTVATPDVAITEIMYSPGLGATIPQHIEYIKIQNLGATPAQLYDVLVPTDNMTIGGFGVTLPGFQPTLAAGEVAYVTNAAGLNVTQSEANFRAAYGVPAGVRVFADPTGGALSGGGERIELRIPITIDNESRSVPTNANSIRYYAVLDEVCYDDDAPWPEQADGEGFSLVKTAPSSEGYEVTNWARSAERGGSAYTGDIVYVSEVLAHTDFPQVDVIELHNPGGSPVDIGGWFLTDDPTSPTKFTIPAGVTIPAGEYWSFNEDRDSGSGFPPGYFGTAFSVSSRGDEIYLFSGAGGSPTGFAHGGKFRATQNGVSVIRQVNSAGHETFPPQLGPATVLVSPGVAHGPGAANSAPRVERAVISEIFYAPDPGDIQFIEIVNISGANLNLFDDSPGGNPSNNWQIEGVTFTFPGNQPVLLAGQRAVIVPQGTDVVAFRAQYSVPADAPIVGGANGFVGVLRPEGEELALVRPDKPDLVLGVTVVPLIEVDAVTFSAASPWPSGAGVSIERIDESGFGNEPTNWQSSTAVATPGQPNSTVASGYAAWAPTMFTPLELAGPNTGALEDFNGDGLINMLAYAFEYSPKEAVDESLFPTASVVGTAPNEALGIRFRQRIDAPDLNYLVQISENLTVWDPLDNLQDSPISNGDGTQTVVHADPESMASANERFLRVVVQLLDL